ncbi:MAG: ABC transporter permease subunit [Candidatus Brocadiae bacterium]|nr:ABC transporter permease subunit [Candidatus Brocadiia bacterium]
MNALITVFWLILVLLAAFWLTTKGIPKIFGVCARFLGFSTEISPVTLKRIKRFKSIKRGYYSFLLITTLLVLSFFLELLINNKALAIYYNGKIAFPAVMEWLNRLSFVEISSFNKASDFGQMGTGDVHYRQFQECVNNPGLIQEEIQTRKKEVIVVQTELKDPNLSLPKSTIQEREQREKRLIGEIQFLEESYSIFQQGKAWCWMPLYPYSYKENFLSLDGMRPPYKPMRKHPLGSDDSGKDVLCQVAYGFRVSLMFALIVAAIGEFIGILIGAIMGYYGGWVDIILQRFIEIWSSIPFLFTIMIIASAVKVNFLLMVVMLVVLRSWMGITYTIRGEFYREKARDYVQAAIAMGASDWKVMTRHILPNALVPVVSYAPFSIVAYISVLVSLDYLGYGLPPGTPSWGTLLHQGTNPGYIMNTPHLIFVPAIAFATTLFMVVLIGEAVREAFDPKVYSRLR